MENAQPETSKIPATVVVVGGGSAGWMAASLLQHAWGSKGTRITLIESSEIGVIGVGEGSTPYLRDFFRTLDIPESEWMPACHATYKCGISFPNWSAQPGNNNYFHPFFSRFDLKTGSAFFHNCGLRRRGSEVPAHPNAFFVAAELARRDLAPIPNEALPFEPDYAYHFDAGLLGSFLKKRALKLGVGHVIDTVEQVKQGCGGNIEELRTKSNGVLAADLFIDCSGFAGLLINKTLKEEFHSFKGNLFNDRAVAIPTPLDRSQPIPSQTCSAALKHGWAWKIPLTSRYGNGYVYASDFVSEEDAERELRAHLGPAAADSEARHLKMRVGRVGQHWRSNCLAIGLSQGFIEPLEATALMLIQYSVAHFIELFEEGEYTDRFRERYNADVNTFFDGVRDYVVAHYQTNTRTDSDYWIANRENTDISDNLAAIFHAWDEGLDFEAALTEHAQALVYLRPSWYCILAGMGRFPDKLSAGDQEFFSGINNLALQPATVTAKYLPTTTFPKYEITADTIRDASFGVIQQPFFETNYQLKPLEPLNSFTPQQLDFAKLQMATQGYSGRQQTSPGRIRLSNEDHFDVLHSQT